LRNLEVAAKIDPPEQAIESLPGRAGPVQWAGYKAPDRRFIIPDWLVRGSAGLFGGQDGVGKSLLAQLMGTCAAAGVPFLGLDIERVRSIYITCEDPSEELQRRQEAINAELGLSMEDLSGWFDTHSLKGHIGNEMATFDQAGLMRPAKRYAQIRQAALDFNAGLLFIDNAAHVFSGNENARHDVAAFLGLLEQLSEELDGAVVLLAHPNKQHGQGNKQGNEYSGSTGWSAHVRNRLFLDFAPHKEGQPKDDDLRLLKRSKANYARRGQEIEIRWRQGTFILNSDLGEDEREDLVAIARASADNDIFLACLAERNRQARAVSERPSRTYAPVIFEAMPESKGIGRDRLSSAMDRLFRIGAIERAVLSRDKGKGRDIEGLRATSPNTPKPHPQTVPERTPNPTPNPTPNAPQTPPQQHPSPKGEGVFESPPPFFGEDRDHPDARDTNPGWDD